MGIRAREAAISFIGKAIGAITGANAAAKATDKAGKLQYAATQEGIAEQRRQFDLTRSDLMPWQEAGQAALGGQLDLIGQNGVTAQQASIDAIRGSPMFSSLNRQGEEAILQNASATGGLRGGNVQGSLANFRSDLLSQLIDQQLGRLGGISGAGQQTGVQLGELGANSAGAIANLLGQGAAARGAGIMAKGNVARQGFSDALGIASVLPGIIKAF